MATTKRCSLTLIYSSLIIVLVGWWVQLCLDLALKCWTNIIKHNGCKKEPEELLKEPIGRDVWFRWREKVKRMHEKIKSGFLKMNNRYVLLLMEMGHRLGLLQGFYKTTAKYIVQQRQPGKWWKRDHSGYSFGGLRWLGDIMGRAMEAWPTWTTAAQCLKANVNWTAHLPHVRIINTFTGCFKLLYSRKRRGLWRVHNKQGREVSVYVKSVKGASCFPSVATIPWTTGYTFSSLVRDYKPFRAL